MIIKNVFSDMPEGLHDVTITQIEDLGLQESQSGMKTAAIHFTADDCLRYSDVCLKVSTRGFHPKSNLGKVLTQLGFPLGDTFDLTNLIGIKCQVLIQQEERDGRTYATVAAVRRRAGAGRVVR